MKKHYAICLAALLLCTAGLFAQEDVLRPKGRPGGPSAGGGDAARENDGIWITWGLDLGINYNMYAGDLGFRDAADNDVSSVNTSYKTLGEASGLSFPYIGAFVDFHFTPAIGLQVKLAYDPKYVQNEGTGELEYLDENDQLAISPENYEFDISGSYINLGVNFRYTFDNSFVLLAGPLVQIPAGKHSTEFSTELTAPGVVYVDPVTQEPLTNRLEFSDEFDVNTRFGLEIGVAYKIPLTESLYLTPGITYQHMMGKYMADAAYLVNTHTVTEGSILFTQQDRSMNSLRFSVGFWFE